MAETTLPGALKIAEELRALIAGCPESQTSALAITAGAATLHAEMQLVDLYRATEESLRSAQRLT